MTTQQDGGTAQRTGVKQTGTQQTPGPAPLPPHRPRGRIAATVSIIGEILITLGVVLALFVGYSLWWTNVTANRDVAKRSDKVRHEWRKDTTPARDYQAKDGIGFLHIPAMGKNYQVLIAKGTNGEELNRGVAGYYTKPRKAALPWEAKGNFAMAAHRDGHGAKFHNLDKVRKNDVIVVETKDVWYVYRVFKTLPQTSKYNIGVVDAVPKGSGKKKAGRYITLTTCTPVFTSRYRLIVWGELVRTEKVDDKRRLPKELL